VQTEGKAAVKIVPPRPRIPWYGVGADSEEKRDPVSDIDIAVADSLKVLDLGQLEKRSNQPARHCNMSQRADSGHRVSNLADF
jgi:hypothetical protein